MGVVTNISTKRYEELLRHERSEQIYLRSIAIQRAKVARVEAHTHPLGAFDRGYIEGFRDFAQSLSQAADERAEADASELQHRAVPELRVARG